MSPTDQKNLNMLMTALQNQSGGYRNFNADANYWKNQGLLNFNADANYYQNEGILNVAGPQSAAWAQNKMANANLSTFRVRIFYTPVAVVPLPVPIIMFASAYNNGVFSPAGDLVFTNAGGDTATIRALGATTFQAMMDINDTEPMRIEFLRIRPKSETQLENPIRAFENSQFSSGSFNEVSPDDYITPNQYQLLRSDTPLGYDVSKRRGLTWTIDPDQTGTGIGMVMFISGLIDPVKPLQNKPLVRKFGPNTPFFTSAMPENAIQNLIAQKTLGNLEAGNV